MATSVSNIRRVIGVSLVTLATVLVALGLDIGVTLQSMLRLLNQSDSIALRITLVGCGLVLYGTTLVLYSDGVEDSSGT